jgi:hypothetical protein
MNILLHLQKNDDVIDLMQANVVLHLLHGKSGREKCDESVDLRGEG